MCAVLFLVLSSPLDYEEDAGGAEQFGDEPELAVHQDNVRQSQNAEVGPSASDPKGCDTEAGLSLEQDPEEAAVVNGQSSGRLDEDELQELGNKILVGELSVDDDVVQGLHPEDMAVLVSIQEVADR